MPLSTTISIITVLMHGGLLVGTTILHEILFNHMFFDFTIFMLILQLGLSLLVLEIIRLLNLAPISAVSLERGKDMLVPSILYCLHSYFSMAAVQEKHIPMYGMLKRSIPLVTLYLGYTLVKKPRASPVVALSVMMISGGAVIANAYDFTLDRHVYIYGIICVACQALFLILIERLSSTSQYSTLDICYLNSFNGLILFLLIDIIYDEFFSAIVYFIISVSLNFLVVFSTAIIFGALFNFSIILCTTTNSALSTSIVGNVKAVTQVIVGYVFGISLFYDAAPSFWNVLGVVICMAGCALYTYANCKDPYRRGHLTVATEA